MKKQPFVLNPLDYGIPDRQKLVEYRIWDSHYHGLRKPKERHYKMMFYVERMGIERLISLDIGHESYDEEHFSLLERDKHIISGIAPINPGFPDESCAKMEQYIRNGPCIGIKYSGGNKLGITCDHPNNDRIIKLAAEIDAVIYIHTWIKVGGSPRFPGGNNNAGESTPMDVALLAQRFPDVPMICGHAGGDWELGARAIRPYENILFEFAGADPQSGSVDYAVNLLGADRLVWGGHGSSRSYSTELSKVLDASVSDSDRKKIFGGNYRRISKKIFQNKGIKIEE